MVNNERLVSQFFGIFRRLFLPLPGIKLWPKKHDFPAAETRSYSRVL